MNIASQLADAFLVQHPEKAAQVLDGFDSAALADLLSSAAPAAGAGALQHVLPQNAADALAQMAPKAAAQIASKLPFDAQLLFLSRIESDKREQLLGHIDKAHANTIRRLIRYPKGSAGKLMDPSPLVIRASDTVSKARKRLRSPTQSLRYYVYVIDDQLRLVGVITLRQLMMEKPDRAVATLMEAKPVSLPATASTQDIVRHPRWRDFHSLPVVDQDGSIVGVIPYETLRRLQSLLESDESEEDAFGTVLALSELFWLGMSGSLDMFSSSRTKPPRD